MIKSNLDVLQKRISNICNKLGRNPLEIHLIGVTKYSDSAKIIEAVNAGIMHIGENRVQDAKAKFSVLNNIDNKVVKHLIGHLQTNKVKDAVSIFDLIQSVDSFKLAAEIDKQASKINKIQDVLIQVNTAGEEQKFGISPDDFLGLFNDVCGLKNIRIKGLMCIAPFDAKESVLRKCFSDLRDLKDKIVLDFGEKQNFSMDFLSMGMTDDFEVAIEEGSNMIRIGRAIFKEEE